MGKKLALFVTKDYTQLYARGLKTWDIRTYTTNYRGDIYIVESKSNRIIAILELKDCILLDKEMWEMNYHKHRVLSNFEYLSYNQNGKHAYAWEMEYKYILDDPVSIKRTSRSPYIYVDEINIEDYKHHTPNFEPKQLLIKDLPIDNETLYRVGIFLLDNNYLHFIMYYDMIPTFNGIPIYYDFGNDFQNEEEFHMALTQINGNLNENPSYDYYLKQKQEQE